MQAYFNKLYSSQDKIKVAKPSSPNSYFIAVAISRIPLARLDQHILQNYYINTIKDQIYNFLLYKARSKEILFKQDSINFINTLKKASTKAKATNTIGSFLYRQQQRNKIDKLVTLPYRCIILPNYRMHTKANYQVLYPKLYPPYIKAAIQARGRSPSIAAAKASLVTSTASSRRSASSSRTLIASSSPKIISARANLNLNYLAIYNSKLLYNLIIYNIGFLTHCVNNSRQLISFKLLKEY